MRKVVYTTRIRTLFRPTGEAGKKIKNKVNNMCEKAFKNHPGVRHVKKISSRREYKNKTSGYIVTYDQQMALPYYLH